MPDHVHLLVYGTSEAADLRAFVVDFKKVTGFEYRQRQGRHLWQPGYFDRVLRDDESTEAVARYTLQKSCSRGIGRAARRVSLCWFGFVRPARAVVCMERPMGVSTPNQKAALKVCVTADNGRTKVLRYKRS